MEKIFKILLSAIILELIISGIIVFSIMKIALAQSIGIGVMPAIVKFNSPGTYIYEFCFFNQGDTDAIYEVINGEVLVQYKSFEVPAGTNITNCIKQRLVLTVTKPGYFYVVAKAKDGIQENQPIFIERRIGIKVELANYYQETTYGGAGGETAGGGGTFGGTSGTTTTTTTTVRTTQTTTTTISNETLSNISEEIRSIIEVLNTTRKSSETKINLDIVKIVAVILVAVVIIFGVYYLIQII